MGEQQTQSQPHSEAQPQPDSPSSAAAAPDSITTIETATVSSVTLLPTELTAVPPPPPHSTLSPLAKIPSRPRKIRKLSPDGATPTAPAAEEVHTTTAATPAARTAAAKSSRTTKAANQQRALVVGPRVIARSLSCEGEVDIAVRHLRQSDPLLSSLIDRYPSPTFDTFHTPFLALTRSIVYQQLAFKAGTSIYTRFISLFGGESNVCPETVLAQSEIQLRQIGISGRKASYLYDLSRKYQNGILSDSSIVAMDDKSLFTMLTMVSGIGSWSVHMFMIFSLHRPDVLPINDLGIRKGVQMLYNLEDLPRPSQMDQLCEKWRPYRSVASWYLWRFVEARGTPSSAVAVGTGGVGLGQQQEEHQQQQELQHHHHQQQQQQQQQEDQHHHHQQQPQLLDPISVYNLG
ncbi:unnamed protein product [Linum tenue]|uniref:HhH-GPD domain-containing protein n=1 Tax=Linum tenue TaxID=586396 RepID=A0AAV0LRQ8_9ROSI|nr:unnamed protein product [Linum tenue]